MSADHLYPARPGMLRRGTPVDYDRQEPEAVVVYVTGDRDLGWAAIVAWSDGMVSDYLDRHLIAERVRLDLRDVTARAHAAMAYIECRLGIASVQADGSAHVSMTFYGRPAIGWSIHMTTLARMRCMDGSVTVAEARAALDWAHKASGGEG